MARVTRGEAIAEGAWLVADRQRAGRGRAGRTWFDGAGNFMGSTLARLRPGDSPAQTLALVAGLAVAQAVAEALGESAGGPPPTLKWPNDVLLGGAKLGGILLERSGEAVVVGVGVNLASAPPVAERASTCLAAHGCALPRDAFAALLAARWARALGRWHHGEWPSLRGEWLKLAHPPGTPLAARRADGSSIVGTFAGLAEDGAALLRLADGTAHAIHAGEVEMVGEAKVPGHAAGG
jgi:BirA family biotin operon repressor/biotin-[acetyl-CoA-carboxylase] ligase